MKKLILFFSLLIPSPGFTQQYSIDWFTIDGGGGTSTGGVYSVSGTIGQPDASGTMTGGNYCVVGGFWSLFAVQTPGAPTLRIFLTTTNTAVVAWLAPSTGYSLQQNTNLVTTNWSGVTNAVNVVGSENQVIISPPQREINTSAYFISSVSSALGLGLLSHPPIQNFQLHGALAVELVDLRREGEIEKLRRHTAGTNFAGERGDGFSAE
jgi:hypothetical protein